MYTEKFDTSKSDTQATEVKPVKPDQFDFKAYQEYESSRLDKCEEFWNGNSGILVYRRMRVAEVFSYGSADMKQSLEWQLGALQESMKYKADVPNFLEPWYGIGTAASAFGIDYIWNKGQAPAVEAKFKTTSEAVLYDPVPIADTPIGKHTLNMIEYFLEQTKGKLPLSYCDVQSPLNAASNIVDINNFMMDMMLNPEAVKTVLDKLANLIIDFSKEQQKLIGDCLALPGHGFASCRRWDGFGMSDDNVVMLPNDIYEQVIIPSFVKTGDALGGPVFHSCGNWSGKIQSVKNIPGLKMVDGAFSVQTDPDPNPTEAFKKGFANTGIVLNARIVGNLELIERVVKELWEPGMKLVVVTYCQSPEEQAEAYELIRVNCRGSISGYPSPYH